MSSIIDVRQVSKSFGSLRVINNCSLSVEEGSITGLIGPNGAGKSTLFNIIAGNLPTDSGRILFDNRDITGIPPNRLLSMGLLRTFQIAHEFHSMTVRENLMMVPGEQAGENLFSACFRPSHVRHQEAEVRQRALDVLDFLSLSQVRNELAGNLSGGQKKLLELGRTMMTDAKVVFLDEVGAGVNRTLLNTIGDAIIRLNKERGYTFVVIEHDMDFIERLCDPVICMAEGKVLAQGSLAEIKANEHVIEAYLGTGLKNKDKIDA